MQWVKYRPSYLNEFVGQTEAIETLKIFLENAKRDNQVLDHVLFYGLSGVGKTSLATIIANELKQKIHFVQGANLKKVSDLLNVFSLVNENEVVFIDEIHSVHPTCIEMLYLILEDFVIDISVGMDNNSKLIRMKLPKFCMISGTNQLYKLPTPLIDRFGIQIFLDAYKIEDIVQIIQNIGQWNNVLISDNVAQVLAAHAKGIPRIAINLLKKYLAYKEYYLNLSEQEIINKMDLLPFGLNEVDLKYLLFLKQNLHAVGLKTISQYLFLDTNTIENKIEPYLLQNNLIIKTTKGRLLTKKACQLLNEFIK